MADDWQNIPEDEGLTLGPEDALEREIVRSKALKVERLQLRYRVEKLAREVAALTAENRQLKTGLDHAPAKIETSAPQDSAIPTGPMFPARWAFYLLAFNLTALGLLIFFLLKK